MTKYIVILPMILLLSGRIYGAAAIGPDGSNAAAVHARGITGTGIKVGFISAANTRTTHEAFSDANGVSHAFAYNASGDASGIVISDHDTWVAGIIGSRGGATHPNDIGVAPGVDIHNARVISTTGMTIAALESAVDNALDDLINNHGCHVICTGFQLDPKQFAPNGTSTMTKMYDYYADTCNVVFANAAGNSSASVTVFGDAYNGITTGGLDAVETVVWRKVGAISNRGLTADERRKPDLVAPSQNQTMPTHSSYTAWHTWTDAGGHTSLSAPHTAGVAALLLEYADSTTEPDDDENEVIRAVIVNSTFPNIRDNSSAPTTGQLYNVARGYGRIDALRSYQTLAADRIIPDDPTPTEATRGWAYTTISAPKNTTRVQTYSVHVAEAERLIVTIAWNRAITRTISFGHYVYGASPLLNLYLTVRDPGGNPIPTDTDTKNNLKKCDILLQDAGVYEVQVTLINDTNSNTPQAQDYGLAFEVVPAIRGDFDLDYIVDYDDLAILAGQWLLDETGLISDLAAPTGHIDFYDLAVFSQNWLISNNAYYEGY